MCLNLLRPEMSGIINVFTTDNIAFELDLLALIKTEFSLSHLYVLQTIAVKEKNCI